MSDEHYFILKDIRRTHVTYLVMEVKTQELTMPKRSHFHSICTFFPELFQMTICHQNGIFAYRHQQAERCGCMSSYMQKQKQGDCEQSPWDSNKRFGLLVLSQLFTSLDSLHVQRNKTVVTLRQCLEEGLLNTLVANEFSIYEFYKSFIFERVSVLLDEPDKGDYHFHFE